MDKPDDAERTAIKREISGRIPAGTWQGDWSDEWDNAAVDMIVTLAKRVRELEAQASAWRSMVGAATERSRILREELRFSEPPTESVDHCLGRAQGMKDAHAMLVRVGHLAAADFLQAHIDGVDAIAGNIRKGLGDL